MRRTMEQIGEELNLSQTTVSLVYNNRPNTGIAEGTKKRVLKVLAKHRYVPNEIARSLVTQKIRTIGVIAPFDISIFSNWVLMEIMQGISKCARETKYNIMFYPTAKEMDTELSYVRLYGTNLIEGLIIINTRFCSREKIEKAIKELRRYKIPFVMINNYWGDKKINYVSLNERDGVRKAVDYIVSLKYKKIGFINGLFDSIAGSEMLDEYRILVKKYQLDSSEELVVDGGFDTERAKKAMGKLLGLKGPPKIVFVASGEMTLGAISTIEERGLKIGKDVQIVSVGATFLSHLKERILALVDYPLSQMGKSALEMLLSSTTNKKRDVTRRLIFDSKLNLPSKNRGGKFEDYL